MASDRDRAIRGDSVDLSIQYTDVNNDPIDAEADPSIQILDENGDTVVGPTFDDVARIDVGLYRYTYEIASDAEKGLWSDIWTATVDGTVLENEFKFLVADELITTPGTIRIGDDVVFDFSDEEIYGINIMLKFLKARLRSDGRKPLRNANGSFVVDGYGQIVTEECNVFSDDILVCFLCQALSEFNMIPFFTAYSFADRIIQTLFVEAIVEGAYIFALASQAIIERGREFIITDGGVSYQPPMLGEFLQSHFGTWLTSYRERLKFIKNSIRPGPKSFGTYSTLSSGAPAVLRLRHIRSRRII